MTYDTFITTFLFYSLYYIEADHSTLVEPIVIHSFEKAHTTIKPIFLSDACTISVLSTKKCYKVNDMKHNIYLIRTRGIVTRKATEHSIHIQYIKVTFIERMSMIIPVYLYIYTNYAADLASK